jgi:hypothetical protein
MGRLLDMQLSRLCFVTEPPQFSPSRRVATLLPISATIANHPTQEGMSRFCIVTDKLRRRSNKTENYIADKFQRLH